MLDDWDQVCCIANCHIIATIVVFHHCHIIAMIGSSNLGPGLLHCQLSCHCHHCNHCCFPYHSLPYDCLDWDRVSCIDCQLIDQRLVVSRLDCTLEGNIVVSQVAEKDQVFILIIILTIIDIILAIIMTIMAIIIRTSVLTGK